MRVQTETALGAVLALGASIGLSPSAFAEEQGAARPTSSTTLGVHVFADTTEIERDSGVRGDDNELRLIRFDMKHSTHWGAAVLEVDVAGEELSFTDAYVEYKFSDDLRLLFGQFKEPNGLEQLSSAYGKTFVRNAGVTSINQLDRRLGVGVRAYEDEWTLDAGVYASNINEDEASNGWALAGRAAWAHELDDSHKSFAHLAGSVRYRESEDALFSYSADAYSFALPKTVRTPSIAESDVFLGFEAGLILDNFSVVGEASRSFADCPTCASDPEMDAAYVDVSYVIGGNRKYDPHGAKFGRYHVDTPLGGGGWGALEFAARWDYVDLTDGALIGGSQTSAVAGVTYHANENVRLQLNYVHSDIDAYTTGAANDADAITLRLQLDFSRRV
jgi:phosphate-selective porin OprO and OprP